MASDACQQANAKRLSEETFDVYYTSSNSGNGRTGFHFRNLTVIIDQTFSRQYYICQIQDTLYIGHEWLISLLLPDLRSETPWSLCTSYMSEAQLINKFTISAGIICSNLDYLTFIYISVYFTYTIYYIFNEH